MHLIQSTCSTGLRKPLDDQVTTGPILLYQLVLHGSEGVKSYPVAQMLSQMHDMEFLTHWLCSWQHQVLKEMPQKKKLVDEIIVDESAALIGACVNAFTQDKSTVQYIDRNMNVVLYNKGTLSTTYVRIDSSHFIKSVHRNLRKGFAKTNRLLRGVLGYLIKCTSVKEFERIMKDVFTVIRNEYVSEDVTKSLGRLNSLVCTHNLIEEEIKEKSDDMEKATAQDDGTDIKSYKDTCSYRWVMEAYNSVDLSSEQTIENIHYLPSSVKYLTTTFVRCCLWSNILVHEFESTNLDATSTPVENEFKTIKSLVKIGKKRVDSALKKHLQYLSGQMKQGKANQNYQTKLKMQRSGSPIKTAIRKRCNSLDISADSVEHMPRTDKRRSLDESNKSIEEMSKRRRCSLDVSADSVDDMHIRKKRRSLDTSAESVERTQKKERSKSDASVESIETMPVENYRGWIDKEKKTIARRRAVNSILNPHDPNYYHADILLLENGYESPKVLTTNTCSFDSIYPIFCAAILDNENAKRELILDTPFSAFLQAIVNRPESLIKVKNLRNTILYNIFANDAYKNAENIKERLPSGKQYVDCFTGLAHLFRQLGVSSYTELSRCTSCGIQKKQIPQIPLRTHKDGSIDLDDVESSIFFSARTKKCVKCQKGVSTQRVIHSVIALEVEPSIGTIDQIQREIRVESEKFKLLGLVAYKDSHFTSYILRRDGIWEHYDDGKNAAKRMRTVPSDVLNINMLFYVKI